MEGATWRGVDRLFVDKCWASRRWPMPSVSATLAGSGPSGWARGAIWCVIPGVVPGEAATRIEDVERVGPTCP